jgi:hypothetical protein
VKLDGDLVLVKIKVVPQGRGRDLETDPVICRQNRHVFCGFLGIAEFNIFYFQIFCRSIQSAPTGIFFKNFYV